MSKKWVFRDGQKSNILTKIISKTPPKVGKKGGFLIAFLLIILVVSINFIKTSNEGYNFKELTSFDDKKVFLLEVNNGVSKDGEELLLASINGRSYSIVSTTGTESKEEILELVKSEESSEIDQSLPLTDGSYAVIVDEDIEEISDEFEVVSKDDYNDFGVAGYKLASQNEYDYFYLKVTDEQLLENGYYINDAFANTKTLSYVDVSDSKPEIDSDSEETYYSALNVTENEEKSFSEIKEQHIEIVYESMKTNKDLGINSEDDTEIILDWVALYTNDDSVSTDVENGASGVVYSEEMIVKVAKDSEFTGFVSSAVVKEDIASEVSSTVERRPLNDMRSLTDDSVYYNPSNQGNITPWEIIKYTVINSGDNIPVREVVEYDPTTLIVDTDIYFSFSPVPGATYWYAFQDIDTDYPTLADKAGLIEENSNTSEDGLINWVVLDETNPNVIMDSNGKYLVKLPVINENQTLLVNTQENMLPFNVSMYDKWFNTRIDAEANGAETKVIFNNTNFNDSDVEIPSLGSFYDYAASGKLQGDMYYTTADGTRNGPVSVIFDGETVTTTIPENFDNVYSIDYTLNDPYGNNIINSGIWRNYDILGECLSNCDYSDAPESYGSIKVAIAETSVRDSQRNHKGIAIGYDNPDPDDDVVFSEDNALSDDRTAGTDGSSRGTFTEGWPVLLWGKTLHYDYSDDETGLGGKTQNSNGEIEFNIGERYWYMEVPYLFDATVASTQGVEEAKMLIWLDLNQNGIFDEGEGQENIVTPYTWVPSESTGQTAFSLSYQTTNFSWDLEKFQLNEMSLKTNGTYMRVVMTTDMSYTLADAATSPVDSVEGKSFGEIEDYKIIAIDNRDECGTSLVNNAEMIPSQVIVSGNSIKYEDVKNPYGSNVDIVVTADDGTLIPQKAIDSTGTITFGFHGYNSGGTGIIHPGYFKVQAFETGTDIPISIPIQIRASDLDQYETLGAYPPPSNISYDDDSFWTAWNSGPGYFEWYKPASYPAFTGHLSYDYTRIDNKDMINAAYDEASAAATTLSWLDRSILYFGFNDSHDNAEALDIVMTFPTSNLTMECNDVDPNVIKTSTPPDGTWVKPGEKIHYEVELKADALGLWKQAPMTITDIIPENTTYVNGSGIVNYRLLQYESTPYDPNNPNEVVPFETRNVGYITSEKDSNGKVTSITGNYDGILNSGDTLVLEFDVIVDEIDSEDVVQEWTGNTFELDKFEVMTNYSGTIGDNNSQTISTSGSKVMTQSIFEVDFSRPFSMEFDLSVANEQTEYQLGFGFSSERLDYGAKYGEKSTNEGIYFYNNGRTTYRESSGVHQYNASTSIIGEKITRAKWDKQRLEYNPYTKEITVTMTNANSSYEFTRELIGNVEDYKYIGTSLEQWANPNSVSINSAKFIYEDIQISKNIVNGATACYTEYPDATSTTICLDSNELIHPTGEIEEIVEVDKTVEDASGNGYVENGEEITYSIKVSNTGNFDLREYVVVDTLTDIEKYYENYESVSVGVVGKSLTDGSEVAINYTPNPVSYSDLMTEGLTIEQVPANTIIEITYTLVAKGD
ncbi:MAG: GEVED domain-containing protein, partial [Bacilli bacterium]